jgi:hypothetical protein
MRLYQWVLYIHIHMNDYDQLYIYMNSNVSRFRPEKQWWYRVIPRDNDWDDGRMIGEVDFSLPCLRTPEGIAHPQKAAHKLTNIIFP